MLQSALFAPVDTGEEVIWVLTLQLLLLQCNFFYYYFLRDSFIWYIWGFFAFTGYYLSHIQVKSDSICYYPFKLGKPLSLREEP